MRTQDGAHCSAPLQEDLLLSCHRPREASLASKLGVWFSHKQNAPASENVSQLNTKLPPPAFHMHLCVKFVFHVKNNIFFSNHICVKFLWFLHVELTHEPSASFGERSAQGDGHLSFNKQHKPAWDSWDHFVSDSLGFNARPIVPLNPWFSRVLQFPLPRGLSPGQWLQQPCLE